MSLLYFDRGDMKKGWLYLSRWFLLFTFLFFSFIIWSVRKTDTRTLSLQAVKFRNILKFLSKCQKIWQKRLYLLWYLILSRSLCDWTAFFYVFLFPLSSPPTAQERVSTGCRAAEQQQNSLHVLEPNIKQTVWSYLFWQVASLLILLAFCAGDVTWQTGTNSITDFIYERSSLKKESNTTRKVLTNVGGINLEEGELKSLIGSERLYTNELFNSSGNMTAFL